MKPQKGQQSLIFGGTKLKGCTQNLHAERQELCTKIYTLKRQDPLACETGWSLRAVFKPGPSTVSKLKFQVPEHHQYLQASLPVQDLCLHTHKKKTHWVWLMTGNVKPTFKLRDWNSSLWLHPPQGFLSNCLNSSVSPSTTASMKNTSLALPDILVILLASQDSEGQVG